MTDLPLAGIRVVDLTRILSGPFCSMILGDLGADIIKIETPGEGDPVRAQGVIKDGLSWYFAGYNRNKKSITLDLRTPEGREILTKLLARSDVVVENYRPGVMDDMGFGDARLKAINPAIVHGSITGFGTTGPYRDRPSFDFIAQAMTGFMSLNGGPDDPPLRAGPPISDLVAGLYAALGIVAALVRRGKSGGGGCAAVSLNGGLVSVLSFLASNFLASGVLPRRTGNDHAIVAPYGLFKTRDGEIAIAPSNDSFYFKLIDAIGAAELRDHPEFRTNDLRVHNRPSINAAIEERTLRENSEHWIRVLNAAGVPCSRVMNLEEVFRDPQNIDQRAVVTVPHPGHGDVSMLGSPMQFEDNWLPVRLPAPALGQHTHEVLSWLGLTDAEIKTLRDKKIL